MNALHISLVAIVSFASLWAQPQKQPATPAPSAKTVAVKRVGDPYPFATCPISDAKLGEMGEAVTRLYDGREVRFCCDACPAKFEKDQAASLAKLDEKIIKDQGHLYPLKTSVVTGKDLPAKPVEFVYGNRLIRVGQEDEKTEFLKDPAKHLAALDKAVITTQGKDYPVARCAVSGEEFGGDMGEPAEVVMAGRLIKLCCKGCQKRLDKDPAKYIAQIDGARKAQNEKGAPGQPRK
jgi:hypothetical protein